MQVGFFAEAGPLNIFVSNHLIPEDFEFNATEDSQFVTTDESTRIRQGTEVRVRIVGTRTDATEIVSYRRPVQMLREICICNQNYHLLMR